MSGVLAFLKTLYEIIKSIKAAWSLWQEHKADQRRKSFQEGVEEKDTKKVEDAFGSPVAGKPDKIGDIEWDDEKTK